MFFGVFSLGIFLIIYACSDAGLQIITQPISYTDDQLAVTGEFCTSGANVVPFPVKILIVMDQSASLQCTDPFNNRLDAMDRALGPLDSLPNVEFGVVGFASWSRLTDFTSNWWEAQAALAPEGEGGTDGPATDYQGSLSTVLRVLEQDMVDSGPALRARTKYVVLFISDGIPHPDCHAGCDDDDDYPGNEVCNTTENIPDEFYVDMYSLCPDYNQSNQIMQKVNDLMSLGEFYGVGDLTFNTVLMFADEADLNAACENGAELWGFDKDLAEPLMREMAEVGLGTYRDININIDIDFLDFNYESLRAPYEVAEFFAVNANAVPSETGVAVDSDRDGIDDASEFDQDLERLSKDSDGDSFGDLFELTHSSRGFDPVDPEMPAIGCDDNEDRDGDGLKNCEEEFLGTDPLLPDSDGDRIPDGLELHLGMDPAVHDTLLDHDFDGRLSGAEVRTGTSPVLVNEEDSFLREMRYSVEPGRIVNEEIHCYDFSVEGITLVPTLAVPNEDLDNGMNRILIFTEEEPANMAGSRGRFHVACVEARYLGETYKDPPSGLIQGLNPGRFVELQAFNPQLDCLQLGEDPGAVQGEAIP
ncbi:MAG: VWA domain-containing protein [Proteobacteria bacterium]|nr:VWA domain-containing protein [Pseudomonadota bacterium]